jgi:gas vesicle protein
MTHHDQTERKVCGTVLAGMGIGALIAGIAALLLAPKAGCETRDELQESASRVKDRAESLIAALREKAKGALEDRTSALTQAFEAGKQAYAEKRAELQGQVRASD